jgi:glycosyltransferase involved in cell wall biosynthesis
MACARPIVATAIEGNLDAIVDGESGLLVEVTPGAIAAGISSLLADPIRGAALGQAAYMRVAARFDDRVSIPLLAEVVAAVASIDVP